MPFESRILHAYFDGTDFVNSKDTPLPLREGLPPGVRQDSAVLGKYAPRGYQVSTSTADKLSTVVQRTWIRHPEKEMSKRRGGEKREDEL